MAAKRLQTRFKFCVQQLSNDLSVRVAFEDAPLGLQVTLQLCEVFDDAIVNQGDLTGGLRVGIGLVRGTMGGPTGVAYANGCFQGMVGKDGL